jgi:predicted transcriptional regulator
MKLALVSFIVLITAGAIHASLASLTKEELTTYNRALEQAKYYVYYEELREGKDRAVIFEMRRIGEDGGYWVYEVTLVLRIAHQDFHRKFKQKVEKIELAKPSLLNRIFTDVGKIGGGIAVGILIGILAF